jgi:pimeloyl-ACP methyl ester carboxylesterase
MPGSMLVFVFLFFFLSAQAPAMPVYFKDPQYSFQLLRAMGAAANGAADIGECLKTAYRIKEGDDDSWYAEWSGTARELEKAGNRFLRRGQKLSAAEAYLRASGYYRSAEFFLHIDPKDKRILRAWKKSVEMFGKFAKLQRDFVIKPVRIPFEKTTLPGYYCRVDGSGKRRPLLIVHTGFDGTGEELYAQAALPALKRGYNVLIFEGPGQGGVIRVQHIPFRHNWETVVAPVVDFALEQPEVDPRRLALMGISFGGYLAPRAVAFEHRLKACIANGGVWDFHRNFVRHAPPDFEKMLDDPAAAAEIDRDIYAAMKKDPSIRWVFGNGMWTFGAGSPSELIRLTRPYRMEGVVDKIKCRVLVVDSAGDKDMPGQAVKLYKALRCPKDYLLFTAAEGAEEHCQMGANFTSSERIFGWLDKNL